MQIIELDTLDTAYPLDPESEGYAKRRFMTLFAAPDEPIRVGGTSYVRKVFSFTGESFALKRLMISGVLPKGAVLTPEDSERITSSSIAAFREEYKNQLLVSNMRGFPRLHGYGTVEGDPVILMEWVEGSSVREWMRNARKRGEQIPARAIAALGIAVAHALDSAARLDSTLIHRDISPANIMIRTNAFSVEFQAQRESFDICLIDFGSSALQQLDDPSFTQVTRAWRNATPEYAAPEMLTQDAPNIEQLRKSQSIDVFALCSVLYELYAGHTPWRLSEHRDVLPYQLKTQVAFEPLIPRQSADEPLVQAIEGGLALKQDDRLSVSALSAALQSFLATGRDEGALSQPEPPDALRRTDELDAGVHLEMTPIPEGGRRAGEPVAPGGSVRGAGISRRAFIAGGIIAAAGIAIGGAFAFWGAGREPSPDFSTYAQVEAPYAGAALYPAMRLANSSWVLRDASSATEAPLFALGREPGRAQGNILRAFDATTRRYGFLSARDSDAGGLEAAWLLLPRYADAGDFSEAFALQDGNAMQLAAVKQDAAGLWGYIDSAGKTIIEPAFTQAARFANGYAAVCESERTLWGLIDIAGSQVLESRFRALGLCSEEGLMAARDEDSPNWGYVGLDGDWAIPQTYRNVCRFTEGLAACSTDGTLWGFITPDGKQAIEARFADARPFADGLAPVQDARTGLWGLIDTAGNWKVKPQFLALGEKTGDLFPAHGSPAGVYDIDGADAKAWESYLETATDEIFGYGYIDTAGNWKIAPNYGDTLIRPSEQ